MPCGYFLLCLTSRTKDTPENMRGLLSEAPAKGHGAPEETQETGTTTKGHEGTVQSSGSVFRRKPTNNIYELQFPYAVRCVLVCVCDL